MEPPPHPTPLEDEPEITAQQLDVLLRQMKLSINESDVKKSPEEKLRLRKRVALLEASLLELLIFYEVDADEVELRSGLRRQDLEGSHAKRLKLLRQTWEAVEVVICPISYDGHFTLMSVSKGAAQPVRYFETLTAPRESCVRAARVLLTLLELPEAPIVRYNVSRQEDATCSLFCLHYAEQELRRARGEAGSFPQWPTERRLKSLRGTLVSLHNMLMSQHELWLRREEEAAKKLEEDKRRMDERALRIMTSKGMSKAAYEKMRKFVEQELSRNEGPGKCEPLLLGIEYHEKTKKPEPDAEIIEDVGGVDETDLERHGARY